MRLSDLQSKDIVSLDGINIGKIIDVLIDENGNMLKLIIHKNKIFSFNNSEIEIKWNQIKKIGNDVILVDL